MCVREGGEAEGGIRSRLVRQKAFPPYSILGEVKRGCCDFGSRVLVVFLFFSLMAMGDYPGAGLPAILPPASLVCLCP